MNHTRTSLLAATLLSAVLSAQAASSASSAASDSASSTVGSLSDSLKGSSNSSTGEKKTAAGDYRVVDVAAAEGRPADLRLTLRSEGDGADEFYLYVPRSTVQREGVATGHVVTALPRPYGIEFALGTPQRAFFLVVDDAWLREMRTTAL